jgi:hypothetical protein
MSTKQVFEDKFRAQKFADHDAARAAIKKAPMLAEYVLEVLIDRGALEVTESGELIGGQGGYHKEKDGGELLAYVGKTWGSTWPKKESVLTALKTGSKRFGEIQADLEEMGDKCGHWTVIHSLRFLLKTGEVIKTEKTYRLASAQKSTAIDDEKPDADTQILIDACLKVGGIYPVRKVAEEVKKAYAQKGVTWTEKPDSLFGTIQELEEAGWIPVGKDAESELPE